MLILHAAQPYGELALWAEDSDPDPKRYSKPKSKDHPYAATPELLAQAVGLRTTDAIFMPAIAWLPTQGDAPVPSSPLAGPRPQSRAKPRIKPWNILTLSLHTAQTAQLLQACHGHRTINHGVIIGPDLAYWTHVLKLALSMTARQQFLPNAHETEGQTNAAWTPVFSGEDAQRLAQLAALMPAPARALTGTATKKPPATAAQDILIEFITAQVDHLARTGTGSNTRSPTVTEASSVHDAWLSGLTRTDPEVHSNPQQLQKLRRQAAEWQRPANIKANSPYRLCLRLEEPPEPDPDEDEQAIRQEDWYLRYLLQPHDDHSLLLPAQAVWKNQLNGHHPGFNDAEFLLSSLAQAGTACPPITDSLKKKHPDGKILSPQEAHGFLETQAAELQQAGFGVMLPAWWTRQATKTRPTIRARAKTPSMQGGSGMSMTSLIKLNIDVALGDDPISPEELQQLAGLKVPLVRFRGQWLEINAQEIQAAADFWRDRDTLTLKETVQIGLQAHDQAEADNVSLIADGWLKDLLEQLQQKAKIEVLTAPSKFEGELRHYQQLGYSWLAFLARWGLGACLADDMGLGKTVQTLAALQRDSQEGNARPNLLVCPTSVINNWQREAAKFTPGLAVLVHHGPSRSYGDKFLEQAQAHQVVITSYGTMNRDKQLLTSLTWRAAILDEAQNIKNPASQVAGAARSIQADYRVALTGTPVENHVGDLWSIMQFLNPGLLGTQAEFKRNYFKPIHSANGNGNGNGKGQGHSDGQAATDRLQKATGPFILRRLKTDRTIIDDLPDKNETKQYCTLTKEQATLYEAVLREAETRLESATGIARRGSILDTLTKLKQACNHPRHLLGDNSVIEARSGKLTRLQELLDELLPAGDRVLIFSQFAEMGKILQQHVQQTYGLETPFLHGTVTRNNRDKMVQRFQNDDDGPQVFVLSLKAGGSGLNLTRANHVVHYDRWWNPAVENQATDRAFRIGQTKDVHVHKMICAGTLEDRIDTMIEIKQQTANQVVGATSERWLTELSNAELHEVLALGAAATG